MNQILFSIASQGIGAIFPLFVTYAVITFDGLEAFGAFSSLQAVCAIGCVLFGLGVPAYVKQQVATGAINVDLGQQLIAAFRVRVFLPAYGLAILVYAVFQHRAGSGAWLLPVTAILMFGQAVHQDRVQVYQMARMPIDMALSDTGARLLSSLVLVCAALLVGQIEVALLLSSIPFLIGLRGLPLDQWNRLAELCKRGRLALRFLWIGALVEIIPIKFLIIITAMYYGNDAAASVSFSLQYFSIPYLISLATIKVFFANSFRGDTSWKVRIFRIFSIIFGYLILVSILLSSFGFVHLVLSDTEKIDAIFLYGAIAIWTSQVALRLLIYTVNGVGLFKLGALANGTYSVGACLGMGLALIMFDKAEAVGFGLSVGSALFVMVFGCLYLYLHWVNCE